jgi:hypothetical protein
MTWLAAGFLGGLAALVVPWWLHRLGRQGERVRTVGSLMLVRQSDAPQARRRVVRYRVLLALRMLLLTLLAAAFAQPRLEGIVARTPLSAGPARLVAVDVSGSMAGRMDAAVDLAGSLLEGRAALVAAGGDLTLLAPMTDTGATQAAALAGLQVTAGRLVYDGLLARLSNLAEALAEPGESVEIHLISDFQASAAPGRFNALVEGAAYPAVLHDVGGVEPNWQVESLDAESLVVRGYRTPAASLPVTVWLDEAPLVETRVDVPADGRASLTLPAVEPGRHDRRLHARLTATDGVPADDDRYAVAVKPRETPLALIGASEAPLVYVRAALAAGRGYRLLDGLEGADLAIIVDPAGPDAALDAFLAGGGRALIVGGPRARRAGMLAGTPLRETAGPAAPRRVLSRDRAHPALRHLADWRDVVVFRLLGWPDGAGEVLVTLDDGAPLLVEQAFGAGRALVLLCALDPGDSTLVAEPAFVSFLNDTLAYLGEDLLPSAAMVGEPFAIPTRNVQIISATGERLLSLGQSLGRGAITLADPGFYELRTAGSAERGRRYLAVNPPAAEGDLAPMDSELVGRWTRTVSRPPEGFRSGSAVGVDEDLDLAPWLLVVLLALLLVEPLAANGARAGAPR